MMVIWCENEVWEVSLIEFVLTVYNDGSKKKKKKRKMVPLIDK